jgi:hypothetical protein
MRRRLALHVDEVRRGSVALTDFDRRRPAQLVKPV